MKSNVLAVMILLFVGAVNAAPTEVEERVAYTSSLNAMVSVVMNWYDSLVDSNQAILFDKSGSNWDDYRSIYPNNISHIELTGTDLIKIGDNTQYQFTTQVAIFYNDNDGKNQHQQLTEHFVFDVPFLQIPIIKTITRQQLEQNTAVVKQELNSSYFKVRQFSYSWLAYLDGISTMTDFMNGSDWLQDAPYSLKIGGLELTDSISSVLLQRKKYLAKGGHKLRSIDVQQHDEDKNITLNLIIEWRGENAQGKPVIAKIHQEIALKIMENSSWKVVSIKEEHLLPDLKPWQGYLC